MSDDATPNKVRDGLGALVVRLRNASHGYDEWRVQDPKDGSYCIAYSWPETMTPEHAAREWLADHKARFPGGLHSGYVVACVRVMPEKDRLLVEAADEIERLRERLDRAAAAFEREGASRCRRGARRNRSGRRARAVREVGCGRSGGGGQEVRRREGNVMSQDLDDCPCCGGIPKYHDERVTYGHGDFPTEWSVRCECGMRTKGFPTGLDGTEAQCKDKAAAAWNRRAT